MARHKIIVNPVANQGNAQEAIPQIESLLSGHGLAYDLVRTERPWHAAELAQEAVAAGFDPVVAVGGDGTANEVLNGLVLARQAGLGAPAMGVLCVGRGNDFAFGVGIPTDLESGCQVLAQGHRRAIDVGRVAGGLYPEGRYFGNGVGIGFDAVVGFEAAKVSWLHGFPSYLFAVFKTVFLYYNAPRTAIEFGSQTLSQPSLMISIMNGRRMGGGFLMAPEGQSDDGLFDLCIVREVSRTGIFGLIPHFLRGTQMTQEPVRAGRAPSVVVTALEGALPAHADGETLCVDGNKLELEILAGQLDIITVELDPVPPPAQGEGGMTLTYTVVTSTVKILTRILCRVDGAQLTRVPDRGPLIIYGNHVNFLEGPLLYTHLQPRPMFGFVKAETWDNPLLGRLADLWQAIPLRRDELDLTALRQALGALEEGHILGVAPEGTRSGDGCLLRGNPGIVLLALRSGAPLLPLATYGSERFWQNLPRLRRTDFNAVVGQPFSLDPAGRKVSRHRRQQMTDEIMYQLAALLPPEYRGAYSDLGAASESYLHFPPGAHSNLLRA